ncbi:MAG: aldo/keto reductase [Rhodobacteraceae bacterium]|jgi:D-threo-aldose 1-dehydrogenase|nr:aldo/keto reductase [Paracoccaceae bacterium]
MKVSMRRTVTRGGLTVTALGLGCAAFGGLYRDAALADAQATLRAAWDRGIRYFDTAPMYGLGRSEHILGDFLREVANPAAEAVVSTKAGRLMVAPRPGRTVTVAPRNPFDSGWANGLRFVEVFDYSYDGILRSFDDSQQRLGRPEIDLIFLHDIGRVTHGDRNDSHWRDLTSGGFRALEELRAGGVIQGFGLGVNETAVIDAAMEEADLDCCLLAGRYTLLDREGAALLDKAARHGVAIVAGGVFNSGILAGGDAKFNYVDAPPEIVARVARLQAVCAGHGVPLGAAAIQFPLRHPGVTSVVVGARTAVNVHTNADWFETEIPDALWADIDRAG